MARTAPSQFDQPAKPGRNALFATLGLLAVGIACWATLAHARFGGAGALVALAIAVVALGAAILAIAPARRMTERWMDRLRCPSPRTRRIVAGALTLAAAIYFLKTATAQDRGFGPVLHDEHAYLIQSRMLARGHLWMPRHELGDFFSAFHLITDPVYAAKYGPGTALFVVPALWMGLDPWIVPLVLVSLSVGLLYLVLAQTIDALAGLLGALMLPSLGLMRRISIEVLSAPPMLFLALLAVWAFLRWRDRRSGAWLAVVGAAVGWAAITRPLDAVCVALPLGVGIALQLRGERIKRWFTTAAVVVVAALPFLTLQLLCNKGITGRWTQLPWSYYAQRYSPYDSMSDAPVNPDYHATSVVPEVRKFEDEFVVPAYRAKLATPYPARLLRNVLTPTLDDALPNPLLLVLVPVGLLGLFARGRYVLAAMLLPFLLIYPLYPFFLAQYATVAAPALILLALVGCEAIVAMPGVAGRPAARALAALAIAALALAAYPQFRPGAPADEWDVAPIFRLIDARLADLSSKPAVVLFRFDPIHGNPHVEPVYNTDVAWPDDAPVIRAHDLGPERNRELFRYYARQSRERGTPDRAVYLYDLSPDALQEPPRYLGKASELARIGG